MMMKPMLPIVLLSAFGLYATGSVQAQSVYEPYFFTRYAGLTGTAGSTDGARTAASFNHPGDLAMDTDGNIYVADTDNHTIRKITAAGVVSTLAGAPGEFGTADGSGGAARFSFPTGIAIATNGDLYVADYGN